MSPAAAPPGRRRQAPQLRLLPGMPRLSEIGGAPAGPCSRTRCGTWPSACRERLCHGHRCGRWLSSRVRLPAALVAGPLHAGSSSEHPPALQSAKRPPAAQQKMLCKAHGWRVELELRHLCMMRWRQMTQRQCGRSWKQPPTQRPTAAARDEFGYTPLFAAAIFGSAQAAKVLLDAVPDAALVRCSEAEFIPLHAGKVGLEGRERAKVHWHDTPMGSTSSLCALWCSCSGGPHGRAQAAPRGSSRVCHAH